MPPVMRVVNEAFKAMKCPSSPELSSSTKIVCASAKSTLGALWVPKVVS